MSEEEKEAIENTKNILKEWQKIVDIKDPIERDIEMSMYSEEMPFYTMKTLLNLIDKQQKDLENLKEVERQICDEELITKDKYQDILKENAELKELIDELAKENEKWIDSGLDYVKRYFKDYIHKDKIIEALKDIYFYYGPDNDMFLVDKIRKELLGDDKDE